MPPSVVPPVMRCINRRGKRQPDADHLGVNHSLAEDSDDAGVKALRGQEVMSLPETLEDFLMQRPPTAERNTSR